MEGHQAIWVTQIDYNCHDDYDVAVKAAQGHGHKVTYWYSAKKWGTGKYSTNLKGNCSVGSPFRTMDSSFLYENSSHNHYGVKFAFFTR